MTVRGERNPEVVTLLNDARQKALTKNGLSDEQRGRFFARVRHADAHLDARQSAASGSATRTPMPTTHRQLLLEVHHVINVHSRLCEVAADVVPARRLELLAGPAVRSGARLRPGRIVPRGSACARDQFARPGVADAVAADHRARGVRALPAGGARDGRAGRLPLVLRAHAAPVLSAVGASRRGAAASRKRPSRR